MTSTSVARPGVADVTSIVATRMFYENLAAALAADVAQIELALGNLAELDLDEETLDNFQSAQADAQRAMRRCLATVTVLNALHGGVEQAVLATPYAARIDFYREEASGSPGGRHAHTAIGKDTMNATANSGSAAAKAQPGSGPVPDAADLAGLPSGYWHGSDVVAGEDQTKVWLGLVRYTDGGEATSDAYVAVDTSAEDRWDPDSDDSGVIPQLSAEEATRLAAELDDLIALGQSGAPAPPSKLAKLADRIRGLVGDGSVTIIGNDGEVEVSAAMINELLDTAAPVPATPTRRKVAAKDCDKDAMDNGTIWAELDTSGDAPTIAVTAVEGDDQPEDHPDRHTTVKLPLADASRLAGKLRRFAQAAPSVGTGAAEDGPEARAHGGPETAAGADEIAAQAAGSGPAATAAEPRRVSNTRGKTFEYDPGSGATAVIERDGWRAVVPPGSPTGVAARLMYWNAEIKDGRGDDATEEAARSLLDGLSGAELREVADDVDASARGARTKPQLVDSIVNTAIGSGRAAADDPTGTAGTTPSHQTQPQRPQGGSHTAPAGAATPEPPRRADPTPTRSSEPVRPPNGGHGIDQGLMHFNSALGTLWNQLGDDQHLQVDGHALGNVITDLGEGITLHRHDTNHALQELRRIRTQLPEASTAARHVDVAINRLDAPDRPAPALPDNAPQQLKDLMADLNAIPLVRRGYDDGIGEPFHETDELAEITQRWMAGRMSRGDLGRALTNLSRRRHESHEGYIEIKQAFTRAMEGLQQWRRPPT